MNFFGVVEGYEWFETQAHKAYVQVLLAVLSFTESCVFIIPPDPLLAALVLTHRTQWLYYTLFTTLFSLLGAIFGYFLGAILFDSIGLRVIEFYGLADQMAPIQQQFENDAFLVMFAAAFTPIPFKLFVLLGGFFKVNLGVFILASFAGRFLRYLIVGYGTKALGPQALEIAKRFSVPATIATALLVLVYIASKFV